MKRSTFFAALSIFGFLVYLGLFVHTVSTMPSEPAPEDIRRDFSRQLQGTSDLAKISLQFHSLADRYAAAGRTAESQQWRTAATNVADLATFSLGQDDVRDVLAAPSHAGR